MMVGNMEKVGIKDEGCICWGFAREEDWRRMGLFE